MEFSNFLLCLNSLRRWAQRIRKSSRLAVVLCCSAVVAIGSVIAFNFQPFADATGYISTYNVNGNIDDSNAFFQSLGTNGRTCGSCHIAAQAFGLSAAGAQARFQATNGMDPLFAPVDGANCPTAPAGDAASRSLLLNNGLIRIALTLPASPEFSISAVYDPYGCAIGSDPATGRPVVAVYRRPLPSTNLNFLSAVMFDGRETIAPLNNPQTFRANLLTDLNHQALDATLGHAQAATAPTAAQLSAIVNFELGLSSAQIYDNSAGLLAAARAKGGALYLSAQPYYPGINDALGGDPTGAAFNPNAFSIFAPWASLQGSSSLDSARKAIAAGQALFNTFPLKITAVRGLNNNPALGNPAVINGTCSTCHDTPNVGNHSLPVPLDIATSHSAADETNPQIAGALAQLSVPTLPIYQITGCSDPVSGAPVVFYTSDPGKALISGKCVDVNRIKGPILRGLPARAPYFHNGAASNLSQVVDFYNQRFQMNLTPLQKSQLIAFLNSL